MREMKDSGVEWIGNIPEKWKVCRFKHAASLYTGNSISDSEKDNYMDAMDAVPYIATKDINTDFSTIDYENGLYTKKNDSNFKIAKQGSSIMCIEGGSAGRKKAFTNRDISFVNKLCCFSATGCYEKYLYYFICSPNYESEFRNNLNGLIGGVSVSSLNNFAMLLPPADIQYRIGDYLDAKCAQIDRAIARQQEVIEKLKEYKLLTINEVLANVSENVCHLGFVGNFKNGLNFNSTAEGVITKFLGVGDFKDQFVINSVDLLSDVITAEPIPSEYLLENNDIVFVRSNGSKELVGRSLMVRDIEVAVSFSGFCIRFRNLRQEILDSNYLLYFFRSPGFRKQLEVLSNGSNINNINQVMLSKIEIRFPSLEEQERIVEFFNIFTLKLENAISLKEKIISKLTEYKKSLIYEVVTGKREV